ncbi:MAG: tRNA pseudouridine(55) synthase TruB [Bacteroidales bacterium]|jgi:tRNA pseudouridine55 synthase|nr:tRNA pseudouridine(55) synthase TruB [Bacteroidales bacterium]
MEFTVNSLEDFQKGVIIPVNKPYEWTSFDVVKKIKNQVSKKLRQKLNIRLKNFKVGHAGTLDPLADGLVLVCTGKATKKINELMLAEKEYIATIMLGKTTPSFDLETAYDQTYPVDHIHQEMVQEVLQGFLGEQMQVPPVYSAKNINGKRAYEFARKGESVEMKSNLITISAIELLAYDLPNIQFRVVCSKGTYIRSLARDIGERLSSGAHLTQLTRTRIGDYHIDSSITLEEFEKFLVIL